MNEREFIGGRLRDERKRLGLTQDQLGITPQVQRRYEAGTSTPGADYLATAAGVGIDVLYVITGQRTVGAVAADEAGLLAAYRAAVPALRTAALSVLLSGPAQGSPAMTIHGNVGSAVSGNKNNVEVTVKGRRN